MSEPPARKRRAYAPRMPPEQRRTQLLDAALRLVVTRGHRSVTMEAVADQAGVTKPVVYGMFTDCADLLAALLRREQDQALEQLLAVMPNEPDQISPTKALAGFLQAVRDAPDRWHCIVMPLSDMPAEFHAAREQAKRVTLTRVERIVRRYFTAYDITLDAEIVAHTWVAAAEMAARLTLTDPNHFHADRFTNTLRAAIALGSPAHTTARAVRSR
jgi:AcrR family transcriptional regulator